MNNMQAANPDFFVIAGAGPFGRELAAWLMLCRAHVDGFIDDTMEKGTQVALRTVNGTIKDFVPYANHVLLVSVADPKGREAVVNVLEAKKVRFSSMSAEAIVSTRVQWGEGTILCPRVVLSENAHVGRHTHVNMGSFIGHDVVMGDFCTVSCQCDIMGGAKVGNRVFFGSGSRVLPGVSIGDDCIIGAGAVVGRAVPAGKTVYAPFAREL